MLKGFRPRLEKDEIHYIVEKIYNTKDKTMKKKADKICNMYAEYGYWDFLRDLWEEHN